MRHASIALLAVALAVGGPALAAEDPLLLEPGDRVVFYGDSITQQRMYTRYVQQYVYARYPEMNVRFFNAGWGGDTAKGANARLERDVLHLAPTVVTLLFGMNDGRYRAKDDAITKGFEDELDRLTATLTEKGVRVLVISPGCVDTDRRPALANVDYNATLGGLRDVAARVAKRHSSRFVDLHTEMLRVQTALKRANAKFTMIPDSVHPSAPGHLVMAKAILDGLGVERMPDLLEVTVPKDTERRPIEAAARTPVWIEAAGMGVARACGLLDDLVAQRVTVKDLPTGRWTLSLNGVSAGEFDSRELAAGVPVPGSWSAAGKRLHDDIATKEDRYYRAWREFRVPNARRADPAGAIAAVVANDMESDARLHELLVQDAAMPSTVRVALDPLPEGPNLALGKDYEASDANSSGWGAGGLTDGSWRETGEDCFATGSSSEFPKHVTVDLGRAQRIGAVRLGVPAFGSTRTVSVQVSRNGKSFTEVASVEFAQRRTQIRTLEFDAVGARHVRLVYADHHERNAGYPVSFCFTTELEVYGAR